MILLISFLFNNEKQDFRDVLFYPLRYKEFEINAIDTTWDLELNKVGELAPHNIFKKGVRNALFIVNKSSAFNLDLF